MQNPATFFQHRRETFRNNLDLNCVAIIGNPTHIQYLTGFDSLLSDEREAFLLASKEEIALLYSAFSPLGDAKNTDDHFAVKSGTQLGQLNTLLSRKIADTTTTILFDEKDISTYEYHQIKQFLDQNHPGIKTTAWDDKPLWNQRFIKDELEITALRKAGSIAEKSWQKVQSQLAVGKTEAEIASLLEFEMRQQGATGAAFPTIVAFGPHTALPHHQPGTTTLENDMAVLVDFGANYHGYRSDMTRSLWFGENAPEEYVTISETVMQAYHQTVAKLQYENVTDSSDTEGVKTPNVTPQTATALDKTARDIIIAAGFGPQFIHTTGHGLGLTIHEQPSLNQNNPTKIKPGMAITIEPGIYLPEKYGFRYENTVLIK